MAAACDIGLANDSGSLYWMAANGVPCVGIYDHVQPWLRCYRFPQIKPVMSRWPVCQCHHHGSCSRAQGGRSPCKAIPAEFLLNALAECAAGDRALCNPWMAPQRPPTVRVTISGDGDRRITELCVARALSVLPQDGADERYSLDLNAGQVFAAKDLWGALTMMEMPGADTSRMKVPLRRVKPGA
jgi:hypothetical protein